MTPFSKFVKEQLQDIAGGFLGFIVMIMMVTLLFAIFGLDFFGEW